MDTWDLSEAETIEATDGVHVTWLARGERVNLMHYHLEPGAVVPEHRHEHEQLGFVYEGSLRFIADGTETVVTTGESVWLASNEPHEVRNESEDAAIGIDVFSPPRERPGWMADD